MDILIITAENATVEQAQRFIAENAEDGFKILNVEMRGVFFTRVKVEMFRPL